MAVDEGHGVISHVQADFADRRDSTPLPSIIEPLHQRLLAHELPVGEVVADINYSNGLNYALLEAHGIPPGFPSSPNTSPKLKVLPTRRKQLALLAQRVCHCPLDASIPTRVVGSPSALAPRRAIADAAHANRAARRRARAARLPVRRTTRSTAGRWLGSKAGPVGTCVGCGSARYNLCLAVYSSTTGRSGLIREDAVEPMNDAAHIYCVQYQ